MSQCNFARHVVAVSRPTSSSMAVLVTQRLGCLGSKLENWHCSALRKGSMLDTNLDHDRLTFELAKLIGIFVSSI
jgi:hypothetical protein